jgi:hypothetical protein
LTSNISAGFFAKLIVDLRKAVVGKGDLAAFELPAFQLQLYQFLL